MLDLGVQTKNIVSDENPWEGFQTIKESGFSCADFSLNSYLVNTDLYNEKLNKYFDKSVEELKEYFTPHKQAAEETGVTINQMHMPYPIYIPSGRQEINDYLWNSVAPKSMELCNFFGCPYIVIHGFKMTHFLGSENLEWKETEKFIDYIAPMARDMGIIICIENLYDNVGGHLIEGPCCNVKKVIERIDRVNERYKAEVLGFCFDTGHANLVGLNFENFLTLLGDRLKVLHIHDNDGIGDLHQIPFTFAKSRENLPSTDWEGFIRGLRNIHFNGVLSFETAPVLTAFPKEMKVDVLKFIATIGKIFSEKIGTSS